MPKPVGSGSDDSGKDGEGEGAKSASVPSSFSRGRGVRKGIRTNPGQGPRTKLQVESGEDQFEMPDYPQPLLIILIGEKGTGKSCAPLLIPRRYDGRVRYCTFDSATRPGLVKWPPFQKIKQHVDIFDATMEQGDPEDEFYYPGFDPNEPITAAIALDEAMAWLDQWQHDDQTDNLIVDHAQFMHKDLSPSKVIAEDEDLEGDPMASFGMHHWGKRTKISKLFMSKAIQVPKHALVITGYAEKDSWERKGPQWKEVVKDENWFKKWHKPFHVLLRARKELDREGKERGFEERFYIEVVSSKSEIHDIFTPGDEIEVTGEGLNAFWERAERAQKILEAEDDG